MKIIVRDEGEAIYIAGQIQKAATMLKMTRGIDDLEIQSMEIFLCHLRDAVAIDEGEENRRER